MIQDVLDTNQGTRVYTRSFQSKTFEGKDQ